MAAGAEAAEGILMILVYAAGFLIPFLILGLFTAQVLQFIKEKQHIVKYTIKAGGIILLCMGVFMMNEGFGSVSAALEAANESSEPKSQYDFTLTDQYGNSHTLSDYEGKPVLITFFATWCTYCKQELVHIQNLYTSQDDVVILTIIQPGGNDLSKEEIKAWLTENKYSFPVLFDEAGAMTRTYGISGYPFSFFVQSDGEFFGYIPGYVDETSLIQIFEQLKQQ